MPFDAARHPPHNSDLSRSILYLKRPKMSCAFDVSVVLHGPNTAELRGDTGAVLRFFDISQAVALFDVEHDGQVYRRCSLLGDRSEGSLQFAYEWARPVDSKSRPF